jgi:hypothetical protein
LAQINYKAAMPYQLAHTSHVRKTLSASTVNGIEKFSLEKTKKSKRTQQRIAKANKPGKPV